MANWIIDPGIRILIIVAVGAVLWFTLNKFLPPLVGRTMVTTKGESKESIKKRRDTLVSVLTSVGRTLVVLVGIMMVLSEMGIAIGPILGGLGFLGLAIGVGAQHTIRDVIAGIFIILENEYQVGDVARVAGVSGLVEKITLRQTVLRDLDGIVHHVSNGEIRVASNLTSHFARVNLNVSVEYGTDLDHAISVINRVGKELAEDEKWREVIKSPPQVLRIDNLGDSGIDIKILGDVKPMEQWAVMGELRLRLKKAFDAEDIKMPCPHTKVYFGNALPGFAKKED
jgi:small conductance mechanosensitive channel